MVMHSRAVYYCAVLIVVVSNVVFGLDWQSAPMSTTPGIKVMAYADPPTTPAKTYGSTETLSNNNVPVAQTPSQPKCDASACADAYRTFRESDCTYKPSVGPRQLCTKGVVATEASGAPDAAATSNTDADANLQSNSRCNVSACVAAYGSFNPSDCTYQPSRGARRLCAK